MPSGVALEIVVVGLLVVVLAAAFVITRARRDRALPRAVTYGPPPARPAPRASRGLAGRVRSLFARGEPDANTWRALQNMLVRADVGPAGAAALVERVRERYEPGADPGELLTEEVERIFADDPGFRLPNRSPAIVMVVGVNGTGKTTTIGKLAQLLRDRDLTVALAASDTFRAGATEQLSTWAERTGAQVVSGQRGADPGSVAFDAVKAAEARGNDVLIVDTAGRLHTRVPLMQELEKVHRVLERAGGSVDETLLVLDATTGQNGIAQARAFTEAVGVTGVVLAKYDGTARGGIVIAVREELGLPVKLVGTGEGAGDLEPFDAASFARSLVGT